MEQRSLAELLIDAIQRGGKAFVLLVPLPHGKKIALYLSDRRLQPEKDHAGFFVAPIRDIDLIQFRQDRRKDGAGGGKGLLKHDRQRCHAAR